MLALVLVALSVGLDIFGASSAIGVSGVTRGLRLRIVVVFGTFEAVMPIVGVLIGHSAARDLGSAAEPLGGALLGVVGAYTVMSQLVGGGNPAGLSDPGLRRLVVVGAALSIDNLVIGFALGSYHVNLVGAAATIGLVSIALSLLGLDVGRRLGERVGQRSELVGGAALILVGVAIGTGLL